MKTLTFSQENYPMKMVYKGDTIVCLTKPQLIKLNIKLNNFAQLRAIHAITLQELKLSDSISEYWRLSFETQKTISAKESQKFNEAMLFQESLKKELLEERRRNLKRVISVGIGGTLIGAILGVLLSK
nr:MAG TPA: hypothetical protein [Caudoviricetes sp.]